MVKTDTSGLKRFRDRLEKARNLENVAVKLVSRVAEAGDEILSRKYDNMTTDNERPSVNHISNGLHGEIVASGVDVMFEEFGTGSVGRDSNYKGELPTSGVPITGKWEYNYASKYKLLAKSGKVTGWVHDGKFTRGEKSQQQIFDTARELQKQIPQIFNELVREELK